MKRSKKSNDWLEKKLSNPKFRRAFEAESGKLSIAEQLIKVRLEAGLTQAELAKLVGTTTSAISRYENAEYDRYELRTIQKIVSACNATLKLVIESKKAA